MGQVLLLYKLDQEIFMQQGPSTLYHFMASSIFLQNLCGIWSSD